MRVPLLTIYFFFACTAYASPVGRQPTQNNRPGFKRSPPTSMSESTTPGSKMGGESDCEMGQIQKIWTQGKPELIGTTGSGTEGELYRIKGEVGRLQGREIFIKRITKYSTGAHEAPDHEVASHLVEEAVKRDSFGLRLLHQRAIPEYAVDHQPGQDIYYLVLWKTGDTMKETGTKPLQLDKLKKEAMARVETGLGLFIKPELGDNDFLFRKNEHSGKYDTAYPIEMSNARLQDGKFEDISDQRMSAETFKQCAVKR